MITKREVYEELKEVKKKITACYTRIANTKRETTEQKIKKELKGLEERRDKLEAILRS